MPFKEKKKRCSSSLNNKLQTGCPEKKDLAGVDSLPFIDRFSASVDHCAAAFVHPLRL